MPYYIGRLYNEVIMTIGIYQIKCTVNSKVYVGLSNNIEMRWIHHRSELKLNKHGNSYLQNTYNKYGIDVFIFSILEECLECDLEAREQYYLNLVFEAGNTFNIAKVSKSNRGIKRSEETRKKISIAQKGKQRTPHTQETINKIARSNTGKRRTKEQIEKMSIAAKNKKPITDETRIKLSNTSKNRKFSKESIELRSSKLKGRKRTPEQIERMKQGHKNRKPISEETRSKMSEAQKKRNNKA